MVAAAAAAAAGGGAVELLLLLPRLVVPCVRGKIARREMR